MNHEFTPHHGHGHRHKQAHQNLTPSFCPAAEWLDAKLLLFDNRYRQVPLTIHVVGYQDAWKEFLFDKELTKEVPNIISTYAEGKSTLVFCSSRQSTKVQAQELRRYATSGGSFGGSCFIETAAQQRELEQASVRCEDVDLRETLRSGVGFHNAQLRIQDRIIVEELFTKGALKVLTSTSTLALGVNLPAHLVVIRSTLQYAGSANGYREIPTSNVLQMIGRAGRPGLDTHGVAVIMTQRKTRKLYESLDVRPVESRLLEALLVVLNSEVAQGTISNIADAVEWMRSTFLFIRACKNPVRYNMPKSANAKGITDELQRRVLAGINGLAEYGMLGMAADGYCFAPLRTGQIMSRHYMQFATMKALVAVNKAKDASELSLEALMLVIAKVPELICGLRRDEKKILNEINKSSRFVQRNPKTGTKSSVVQTDQLKNFTLLQAAFAGPSLPPSLAPEWSFQTLFLLCYSCRSQNYEL
jgi:ATP-dependent DNA helicase HFM1/MER3